MGELVEHVEHPILASIVGAVRDKVVGPDMVAVLRPQAALGLLMGNLQPSHCQIRSTRLSLIIPPAWQELGDLAIAIAAVTSMGADHRSSAIFQRSASNFLKARQTISNHGRRYFS